MYFTSLSILLPVEQFPESASVGYVTKVSIQVNLLSGVLPLPVQT